MCSDSSFYTVENVRIEVGPGRPSQCPCNGINICSWEHIVSVDLSQDSRQCTLEVKFSDQAVGENQFQYTSAEVFDTGDSCGTAHSSILLERLDSRQSSWFLSQSPVFRKLGLMKHTPLLNEASCCSGKLSSEQRSVVDPHEGFVFGIDGVEMRRVVVAEVHVDHDPVELAEARHLPNVEPSCDSRSARQKRNMPDVSIGSDGEQTSARFRSEVLPPSETGLRW